MEEVGKYGTPESKAFVKNWDPATTQEIRKRIGLKPLVQETLVRQKILKVSDFTDTNANSLSYDDTDCLAQLLWRDLDKDARRHSQRHRFKCEGSSESSCPEYPIKIGLLELNNALLTAHHFGKVALVVCNGLDQPDRFLLYSCECVVDAKQLLAELHFHRSKTLRETQEELKEKLLASMETHGVGLGLHIRMGDTACDFKHSICAPGLFPEEVFGGSSKWHDTAAEKHFASPDLVVQPDFRVVISTTFSLSEAMTFLEPALPYFVDMAVIEVEAHPSTART
jgi:hypothetical protein